jgi:hypothetical protein
MPISMLRLVRNAFGRTVLALAFLGTPILGQDVRVLSGAASIRASREVHFASDSEFVWARARSYKARFGAGGATYVPFLGSAAGRNFPLALRPARIDCGGTALARAEDAPPARAGAGVAFDHGDVLERYDASDAGLEQSFVIESLPAAGELTIRIGIESELAAETAAGEIRFMGDLGGVRYGQARVIDAARRALDLEPLLENGEIVIRVPREFVERARLPLLVDPLISTITLDDSAEDDRDPDVAYDASLDAYLICWERAFSATDHDVYAQLRDGTGVLLRELYIDSTTDHTVTPRVAGIDAMDQFLVVYNRVTNPQNGRGAITGRTVQHSDLGLVVGAPVQVLNGGGMNPDVGGDASVDPPFHYCVVGQVYFVTAYVDGVLVRTDGQPGSSFQLGGDSKCEAKNPTVSKSNGGPPEQTQVWTAAWELDCFGSTSLQMEQIDDGSGLSGFVLIGYGMQPRVSSILDGASGKRAHLLMWDVSSGRVYRGSNPLTPILDVQSLVGGFNEASLDSDGSSFLMSFASGGSVHAATLDFSDSTLELGEKVPISDGAGIDLGVDSTSTRSGGGTPQRAFAVWNDVQGGSGDIEGALFDSSGPGHRYCTAAPNSVGPGAILYGTGSSSLATNAFGLRAEGCPPGKPGIFFLGTAATEFPFGNGYFCVSGTIARIKPVVMISGAGEASIQLDFGQAYAQIVIAGPPGIRYQFWYRDPMGGGAAFNLSNGLHVEHTP